MIRFHCAVSQSSHNQRARVMMSVDFFDRDSAPKDIIYVEPRRQYKYIILLRLRLINYTHGVYTCVTCVRVLVYFSSRSTYTWFRVVLIPTTQVASIYKIILISMVFIYISKVAGVIAPILCFNDRAFRIQKNIFPKFNPTIIIRPTLSFLLLIV